MPLMIFEKVLREGGKVPSDLESFVYILIYSVPTASVCVIYCRCRVWLSAKLLRLYLMVITFISILCYFGS